MIATTPFDSLSCLFVIDSLALIANTELKGQACVILLHLMSRRNVANREQEFSHLSHSSVDVRRMLVQYSRLLVTQSLKCLIAAFHISSIAVTFLIMLVSDSVHTEQDLSLSQVHTVRMKHLTFCFRVNMIDKTN